MTTLYKVLKDGCSTHGGELKWSLPTQDTEGNRTPGEWHSVAGDIIACQNGLHLTTEPYNWYVWGGTVYEAEGRGNYSERGNKVAYREARLLRPVDDPPWLASAKTFYYDLKDVPLFKPDGNPLPEWKVVETLSLACWDYNGFSIRRMPMDARHAESAAADRLREAQRRQVGLVADSAIWSFIEKRLKYEYPESGVLDRIRHDLSWDAVLYAATHHLCSDLSLSADVIETARKRWEIWQKGYGYYGTDADGTCYVYERPE